VDTMECNKEKTQRRERFEKQRKYGELGKSIAESLKNICDHNDDGNSEKWNSVSVIKLWGPKLTRRARLLSFSRTQFWVVYWSPYWT
jgi:hypothetical protein